MSKEAEKISKKSLQFLSVECWKRKKSHCNKGGGVLMRILRFLWCSSTHEWMETYQQNSEEHTMMQSQNNECGWIVQHKSEDKGDISRDQQNSNFLSFDSHISSLAGPAPVLLISNIEHKRRKSISYFSNNRLRRYVLWASIVQLLIQMSRRERELLSRTQSKTRKIYTGAREGE